MKLYILVVRWFRCSSALFLQAGRQPESENKNKRKNRFKTPKYTVKSVASEKKLPLGP